MSINVVGVTANERERAAFVSAKSELPTSVDLRVHARMDDLFTDLEQVNADDVIVILIGQHIEDLAQLNLVDAVRNLFPQGTIIVILPSRDPDIVNRAMLAGASAALSPEWKSQDLLSAIQRVTKAAKGAKCLSLQTKVPIKNTQKNILVFMSAKGGAGKSTLCALCAHKFALSGLSVAVVDFDLQFGDMRFVFNVEPEKTLNDLLGSLDSPSFPAHHFGMPISENITLFSAQQAPEKAELFYGKVSSLLQRIAQEFDVVLVNTGSFWTLLHIELIEASSQAMCITEQGIISTRATQALMAMCGKLNLPTNQFMYVVNKIQPYGLSANDVCQALGIQDALSLERYEHDFPLLLDSGNVLDAFAVVEKEGSFDAVARTVTQKMGLSLNGVQVIQASMKKSRWKWFR